VTSQPFTSTRIPRATFASTVTERLRDSIVSGTLEPGTELEIATRYGVTFAAVHEAIQRLVQEGLLRSEAHRGVSVPILTDQDVADVYLARDALETAAIQSIIDRGLTETAYQALDTYVTEMETAAAAGYWEAVGRFDLEFHTALVASTGSPRLYRMFNTVISFGTRLCLDALSAVELREDFVAGHRKIADALRGGDAEHALLTAAREIQHGE
jgi:DNA-binding GntR family transcriptional regulator